MAGTSIWSTIGDAIGLGVAQIPVLGDFLAPVVSQLIGQLGTQLTTAKAKPSFKGFSRITLKLKPKVTTMTAAQRAKLVALGVLGAAGVAAVAYGTTKVIQGMITPQPVVNPATIKPPMMVPNYYPPVQGGIVQDPLSPEIVALLNKPLQSYGGEDAYVLAPSEALNVAPMGSKEEMAALKESSQFLVDIMIAQGYPYAITPEGD